MNRTPSLVALAAIIITGSLLAQGRGGQGGRGRPGEGRTPEFPPPTIIEYKPRKPKDRFPS